MTESERCRIYEERMERFQSCGQRDKKIQYALDGWTDPDESEQNLKVYAEFLKSRYSTVVDYLMSGCRTEEIRLLYEQGWISREILKQKAMKAVDPLHPDVWISIMQLIQSIEEGADESRTLHEAAENKSCKAGISSYSFQEAKSAEIQRTEAQCTESGFRKAKLPEAESLKSEEKQIWKELRKKLYYLFPFMNGVLVSVELAFSEEWKPCAFDGERIYLSEKLAREAMEDPDKEKQLLHGILHMLLHGILGHVVDNKVASRDTLDTSIKNMIRSNNTTEVSFKNMAETDGTENDSFKNTANSNANDAFGYKAEDFAVEAMIREEMQRSPRCRTMLAVKEEDLLLDDHRIRLQLTRDKREELKQVWNFLAASSGSGGTGGYGSGGRGITPGRKHEDVGKVTNSHHDYRRFLKRFAVIREEMEPDHDSFDYNYYRIGMEQYGNIPLLEPPETREGNKLEELVIAIDTSGSCSVDTVRRFLAESYAILAEKENFFSTMQVYILQCDCTIQHAAVIHSGKEWDDYCRNLTIEGRAGTDFTPVFRYVEKLRKEKKIRNLKGLIYFTDGDGVYPSEPTDYQTAFVFLEKSDRMQLVPAWAHGLLVRGREIYY